jgi:phosphate transport system permease protein
VKLDRRARRRGIDYAMRGLALVLAALAAAPLVLILWDVWQAGHGIVDWTFLSHSREQHLILTPPAHVAFGGGIWFALQGTFMVVGLASLLGIPIGVLAGVWLSESRRGRLSEMVSTTADAMAGIPSIVAGVFGYALVVSRIGYSAYAAAAALALLMLPTVTRTTEEALRTVPVQLREASLALGSPRWYTVVRVVVPNAWGAIVTGLLLATARIAGETAPVLLTTIATFFPPTSPSAPVMTVPVLIYNYANDASAELNGQAQGAALVLILGVLAINVIVRLLSRGRGARRLAG